MDPDKRIFFKNVDEFYENTMKGIFNHFMVQFPHTVLLAFPVF